MVFITKIKTTCFVEMSKKRISNKGQRTKNLLTLKRAYLIQPYNFRSLIFFFGKIDVWSFQPKILNSKMHVLSVSQTQIKDTLTSTVIAKRLFEFS